MAANRFATMLHRNTNRITLILIYAVLEWILIGLLLLNSLSSYLIFKFAEVFGLKPPCPWCIRIDHVFDPAKGDKNVNRDFLCEVHCKEISKLGFCSNHQKLVDSGNTCTDCLLSRPEFEGSSRNFELFEKMRELGDFLKEKVGENGEVSLNCSCCGVSLDSNDKYSSYILLKTWDVVLDCAHKENLISESGNYDDNHVREVCVSDEKESDFAVDLFENEKLMENKSENKMIAEVEGSLMKTDPENGFICVTVNESNELERGEIKEQNSSAVMEDKSVQVCFEEYYAPLEMSSPQHLEFFLDYSGHKLVPFELTDSVTEELKIKDDASIEEDDITKDQEVTVDFEVQIQEKEEVVVESGSRVENTFLDIDINEEPKYEVVDSTEIEEDENSLFFHAKDSHLEADEFQNFRVFPLTQWPSEEASGVQELAGAEREKHTDVHTDNVAYEEVSQGNNENEADVSIGTEIPDLDITDEIQIQDSDHSYESIHKDPLTIYENLSAADDHGPMQVEKQRLGSQSSSVHDGDHLTNNEPSVQMELKDNGEDKAPDTPRSMESLKLLSLEKRDSGIEESLDGSVTSELDGADGVVTIERLKSALRAERKALQALYSELDEERSASAVATNQTMAMINRLQEEKAAMQMEALQYQRMMDEQSEYDQEALQLLNELMVKREKEKQELERELEVCRKKLMDYETKKKLRVLKENKDGSIKSGFSSPSCSNAEDSDGLSIDLDQEVKEEEGFYGNSVISNQNTPVDVVLNLEESLADFEDERLSILEQLKVLEEKISTRDDENEQHFEDVKAMDDLCENGHFNGEANRHENGYPNDMMNRKHYKHRRVAGQNGKSLLPLFDAISDENENGEVMINENGSDFNAMHDSYVPKLEMGNNKHAIDEEVDHLYERLQALEADREFLKHCVSSLKKGDKGMDLLQEILQHLRDLRHVELPVRNLDDGAMI
ncbi:hypothetical protein OROHE_023197 [Orobanche hederae]